MTLKKAQISANDKSEALTKKARKEQKNAKVIKNVNKHYHTLKKISNLDIEAQRKKAQSQKFKSAIETEENENN